MLLLPLMLPQISLVPVGQSKVFVLSLPPIQLKAVLFDVVAALFLCPHHELRLCSSLPINRSHRCLETRLNSSLLASTCAPRFLVVTLLRIPPSTQLSSTCPTRHRSMAITLWPSNAVLILFFTRQVPLISLSFPAPLPSNLIIHQNIPSYFSTRSTRMSLGALCPTLTLLTRTLASACSVLPLIGRGIS
jgi:hypothetical protein